uniref:Helicase C-terminal domain-containing protein n=1 Tax=Zooxanthella nutricula TaxID=1333877 RepID=A0A7S2VJX0_9DINO|mmetsp:Transcript_79807/g.244044  ORF Transcript_79807/g.244044 Transcript_79807/m.244044 type:complete len:351 (+) Transcript_79807:2-1054(+)
MGFEPQIRKILQRMPKQRQTLFFTATWPQNVKAAAKELTSSQAAQLRIGQGVGKDKLTANKNVRQIVQVVDYWDKLTRLTNILTSELKEGDTCIVFCGSKGRTEHIVDELNKASVVDWCEGIHSGKEQWVRDKTLEHFRYHTRERDTRAVLVATDVAARGIDIPGVAMVVVYDLNGGNGDLNIDSYVHRIGRTGRAGKLGRAFTFVERRDRGIPQLVKLLQDAGQRVPLPLQDIEVDERNPLEVSRKRRRKADSGGEDVDDGQDFPGERKKRKRKGAADREGRAAGSAVGKKPRGAPPSAPQGVPRRPSKGKDRGDGKRKGAGKDHKDHTGGGKPKSAKSGARGAGKRKA